MPLAIVGGLSAIAAQGFGSAIDRMAQTTLFVSAARVAMPENGSASSASVAETPRTPARRVYDRPLDPAEAEAVSQDELIAMSRVSETVPESRSAAAKSVKRSSRPRTALAHQSRRSGTRFTTVCVRLCDGAFFPVSYATTPSHFADDAAACSARCGSPARLYVRRTGDTSEAMKDLDGNPYLKLSTAFAFRFGVASQCTCRAQPWDEASQERHHRYALEARAKAGDAAADRELVLRRALADVRASSPDVRLADLGTRTEVQDDPVTAGAGVFVFGPPVVAPLDESSIRTPPPLRYAGTLQPASVVLDATGSPVRKLAAKSETPPSHVKMLARVSDVMPASVAEATDAKPINDAETGVRVAAFSATSEDADDSVTASRRPGQKFASKPKIPTPAPDEAEVAADEEAEDQKAERAQRAARPVPAARAKKRGASVVAKARQPQQHKPHVAASERAVRGERIARVDLKPDWRELLFRPY